MTLRLQLAFVASAWVAFSRAWPCAEDQSTSWGNSSDELKAPSWPAECLITLDLTEASNMIDFSAFFDVSPDNLLKWNCFVDGQDADLEQGTTICLAADDREDAEKEHEAITITLLSVISNPATSGSPDATGSLPEHKGLPNPPHAFIHGRAIQPPPIHDPNATEPVDIFISPTEISDSVSHSTTSITPNSVSKSATTANPFAPNPTETWNPTKFDGPCDSTTGRPLDCRASTDCKADWEQPVCKAGECTCLPVPCSTTASCVQQQGCREHDQTPVCVKRPDIMPDVEGLCQCEPKVTGCILQTDPHLFCDSAINCDQDEKVYSLWTEHGQCKDSDLDGFCSCETVDCDFKDGEGDHEYCESRTSCRVGEVKCKLKYLRTGGYCTCALDPYTPAE